MMPEIKMNNILILIKKMSTSNKIDTDAEHISVNVNKEITVEKDTGKNEIELMN